jgi:hypothetical protein
MQYGTSILQNVSVLKHPCKLCSFVTLKRVCYSCCGDANRDANTAGREEIRNVITETIPNVAAKSTQEILIG